MSMEEKNQLDDPKACYGQLPNENLVEWLKRLIALNAPQNLRDDVKFLISIENKRSDLLDMGKKIDATEQRAQQIGMTNRT